MSRKPADPMPGMPADPMPGMPADPMPETPADPMPETWLPVPWPPRLTAPGGEPGRGRFITLEGGEGAGKTTQIRLLEEALTACGVPVVATREPGGSPGAEEIRRLLVSGEPGRWSGITEMLLHTAARRDHLERVVWPALAAGCWVLSDRFADSTLTYQGHGHGVPMAMLEAIHAQAIGNFTPDLTLILDLPVEEGLQRSRGHSQDEDRYEQMDIAFHCRIREGFQSLARRWPWRCVLIAANHPPEQVQTAILSAVTGRLTFPPPLPERV